MQMTTLRLTLVSEGRTDANLLPIIEWCLKRSGGVSICEGRRAKFWRLPEKPRGLVDQLIRAVELFPCEVLFVHRDADRESPETRVSQIREAFNGLVSSGVELPAVAVIPVRMLEAWLCFDEQAIRHAAGNPNGRTPLQLPPLKRIESRPMPKEDLANALRLASELPGRRLKKFDVQSAFWRIVDHIDDFSPLQELPAFQTFERAIRDLRANGWKPGLYG